VIAEDRKAVLERFLKQIIEKHEGKESDSEQNLFTGSAPYYDLQLDEAIKVLSGEEK
jgi:hypothetical protein